MKRNRRQEKIESAVALLMQANSPGKAIGFRDLCLFATVSEPEAWAAIRHLAGRGMRIRLTDGLPHKFYCEDG